MSRDRCRTTTNMIGDSYGAAVVEALSGKELGSMGGDQEEEAAGRRKEIEV